MAKVARARKKPRTYAMELVINDCAKVFAEGFRPGGFAKQTVTFQATDQEMASPLFALAVLKKSEEFLAEHVKVVVTEATSADTPLPSAMDACAPAESPRDTGSAEELTTLKAELAAAYAELRKQRSVVPALFDREVWARAATACP